MTLFVMEVFIIASERRVAEKRRGTDEATCRSNANIGCDFVPLNSKSEVGVGGSPCVCGTATWPLQFGVVSSKIKNVRTRGPVRGRF